MLPLPLLLLLQTQLSYAQVSLSVDKLLNFTAKSLPNPPVFALPATHSNISISVALCASSASPPRFFISNDTSISNPGPDDPTGSVFEITLHDGFGAWSGIVNNGGFLSISGPVEVPIEVGISQDAANPFHQILDGLPLLGDTTANQALIFSPPLSNANTTHIDEPTYPNYILPPANTSLPDGAPALPVDVSVFIAPTSTSDLPSLPRTGCAIRAATFKDSHFKDSERTKDNGLWLRDASGWRWQWLLSGLTPLTNYTTYVIENGTKVSGPINFVTKSGSFACPIVHSLPFCPAVNYAVPVGAPPTPDTAYTDKNLPSSITAPLLETLTNFTVSLSTHPCGRDYYSPLVTCTDCQREYRTWLCSIWFTRCSEPSLSQKRDVQQPLSALLPQSTSSPPRSPGLPPFTANYEALLPCLETCTAADRACPFFLGFKCPLPRFTANMSYGVGFIDTGLDGEKGGGSTGAAQDRWGNVWCNGL
ncbi:hypothetical protein BDW22DRAFT_1409662 [Trametopsis cervina]|nr:hypothetical protein BDW22DRAFT_1409662 [Trametopsis cervina]